MSDRALLSPRHDAEYWLKSPGADSAFGPVGAAKLAMLIRAGIVRADSLLSDGASDFQPLGEAGLATAAVPEKPVVSSPKVVRREPVKPEPPAGEAGENRFAAGYEALDVMRLNRMMEKAPELNLPSRWKDPRTRDKLRFLAYASAVSAVFLTAFYALHRSGGMGYFEFGAFMYLVALGIVGFVVFILFPTRPGF